MHVSTCSQGIREISYLQHLGDFLSIRKAEELKGFFKLDRVSGMIEAINYKAVDSVFPCKAALIDRATDYTENAL